MIDLLLASTSPARRALLDSLKLSYRVVAPDVVEELPESIDASSAVRLLAHRKAAAVQRQHPSALVIGGDQLVSFEGTILRKPRDRDEARRQLQRLSSQTHEIHTAVCLLGPGIDERGSEVTRLTMYPLGSEEVERYLDLQEWRGCAGSYRVEGAGQALFSSIDGDRTNVQGLPMVLLVRLLRRAGVLFFYSDGIGSNR